jgi:nicotinamide-nucleotide amidase
MNDPLIQQLAVSVGAALRERGLLLVTAESCTGGGVGAAVTDIAGSSEWYERGFICYSNAAKQEMLGVQAATLERDGAVSEATVREMAAGALAASRAQVAVAVSGIAGPAGGTPEKPVGTVCLAWGRHGEPPRSETRRYHGDRDAVRKQAVARALDGLLGLLRR